MCNIKAFLKYISIMYFFHEMLSLFRCYYKNRYKNLINAYAIPVYTLCKLFPFTYVLVNWQQYASVPLYGSQLVPDKKKNYLESLEWRPLSNSLWSPLNYVNYQLSINYQISIYCWPSQKINAKLWISNLSCLVI